MKRMDKYVSGPSECHIVIDDKFYLVDYVSTHPVKVGDFVKDQWSYTKVVNIIDQAENGYTLFEGIEYKPQEYREIILTEILK